MFAAGRVPKSEKEKPVCRKRYYEEGWLATGNGRGVVGVTFTSSHCRRDRPTPQRVNFNLRGHNSEVVLVRWNEPFQKLATCDTDGGIFVWIQYEGRWSVELVNDRGAQVSDFTWSHDGTQALISYRDGFVLVGSVSGQRHWSSEINLESQITCGIWTPDDQQVLFGTADGQVIVMDCHGRMLAHILLHESDGIVSMSWNYPSFLVEDSSESDTDSDDYSPLQMHSHKPLLTVSFTSGDISLMNNYDDLSPTLIRTGLKDVVVQWCSQGDLLAVAGMERALLPSDPSCPPTRSALVKFYNVQGEHIYTLDTPAQRPITTLCWGHRDSRLFLACGPALYVVRVEHRVANLQLLCQQGIATAVKEEKDIAKLTMPSRLCSYVTTAFVPTIKPPIPDPNNMRDFVSYPTAGNERLHCTMKRTEDNPEVGGPCYTLYLEYLGGLVPILKGRRISKLRPEFVIMDPKTDGKTDEIYGNSLISAMIDSCNCSDSSDIELSDDWVGKKSPKISRGSKSPKLPRINIDPRKSPKLSRATQEISRSPRLPIRKPSIGSPSLTRREFPLDDITQQNYLAQVTSNIWGTKFKIVGLAAFLPTNLGAVIYKTSLLHLQPRQMTIYLPEVRKISMDYINLPVFSPNVFSEDEDDLPVSGPAGSTDDNPPCTVNIPIAPIHSPAQAMSPAQSIGLVQSLLANQNVQLDVLTNPTATPAGATAGGSDQSQDTLLTAQYTVPTRYSSPGQVIFGGLEIGRLMQPLQIQIPVTSMSSGQTSGAAMLQQGALQIQIPHPPADLVVERALGVEHDHLLKIKSMRQTQQLAEGDTLVFSAPLELRGGPSGTPPPGELSLKKGEFSLYPSGQQQAQYPTPLGYERITTFDSSGNVEEVCRPRTRLVCNQNVYTLQGPGSSATLRVTSSSSSADKKNQLPYASATLNRLTAPRYSIPSGDPPPYPDPANQNSAVGRNPGQRLDSSLIHATLRRNSREAALKVSQMLEAPRPLPPKAKNSSSSSALAASFQQRVPTALYTCSQCSSGSSVGSTAPGSTNGIAGGTIIRQDFPPGNGAPHSTVIVHSNSTTPLASQSSYSLLSALEGSGITGGGMGPSSHRGGVGSSGTDSHPESCWTPGPHKPPPLILSPAQHLDVSRLPFVLSPKSPTSPSAASFQAAAAAAGYQISLQYPPSSAYPGAQLLPIQGSPRPCSSPKELVAPVPFSQQDATLVLPPGYHTNLANLTCCPLPPLYPGGSSCGGLPIPSIALHTPWELQEAMADAGEGFQEVLSLTESPVPQRSDKFVKKNRKRVDGRAEEANVPPLAEGSKSKKESRALGDFNSLISSPRLGGRDKKKLKGQKEQQLKAKKLSKGTANSEFQDSSESEPELFISGDELLNQCQSGKKGWKSKRNLRAANELDEIKCRKANEKEDRGLGSQGFVYVMANKQPLWNEATQESAKNFQIELEGRQVMQFGRIDGNAYILDFQYPFSAVQAFAVALANVTQRLK
ncbi:Tubby-related protein 4 [Dissostichus eleginoides]|uniref:Tubby-related protein 4 n=1 Tax=Dissostichus eleginoides TaxID=100907 RepID=A0AAD9BU46_DISEL|nr:Tubby-related protein 4 [Dissostichus eleginoides]